MAQVYDRRVLESPWDEVFDLMWDAYSAGTVPVGAVVVDATGAVVARGRNRIFDQPTGRALGASRLAHAEINALLSLSSERTYEDWALYSALEPCHLCLAAANAARVGTVCFAAADRYGGATGKLVPSADHLAHPVTVEGPLPGEAGRLPELLLVAFFLFRRPDGDVMRFFEENDPELVAAAREMPAPDGGATLDQALVRARGLEPPRSISPTGT
jgi:tRNA(adenine34) deaminase